jgi:hypothetical protein
MIEHKNERPQVTEQLLNVGVSNTANPRSGSRGLRNLFAQSKLPLLIAVATGIWLGFTIAFAWALSSKWSALGSFSNPTDSIRILSIFSEGVNISLPALIASTSSIAMWAMASGDKGITVSTWLSMSPATRTTSLPALFLWHYISGARDWHRPWIIVRLRAWKFLAGLTL